MDFNLFDQESLAKQALKELRIRSLDLYSRLRSIEEDANFVSAVRCVNPSFPMFANLRCGEWYANPEETLADSPVYFKSADGHVNNWSFNLRRPNIHILSHIVSHCGVILVDSTRSGKSMPDSFSKTVPIWCCVINRALGKRDNLSGWDTELHTPPSLVSETEKSQIESRLDGWSNELLNSSYMIPALKLPLRPLWITPKSTSIPKADDTLPFYPVLCVSASKVVAEGVERRISGYDYVQGAGDDHESWSKGLTPKIFWKNKEEILRADREDIDALVMEIVGRGTQLVTCLGHAKNQTAISAVNGRVSILTMNGLEYVAGDSRTRAIWLFAQEAPAQRAKTDCFISIPGHIDKSTKHQQLFLSSILPQSLEHLPGLSEDNIVHVVSSDEDVAVAIALAILAAKFGDDAKPRDQSSSFVLTKDSIKRRLEWIVSDRPSANPPRWMLRRINEFFMSRDKAPRPIKY